MSRKKLRGRKKLVEQLEQARKKDQEADHELAALAQAMLHLCEEKDVEPETLLYQIGLLDQIAVKVLMRKHAKEFLGEDKENVGRKRLKLVHDDFGRLIQVIQDCAFGSLNEADRKVNDKKERETQEKSKGSDRSKIDYGPYYIR
ncbi:hypothetical protein DSECCO2_493930 [anaerobic digester metagenome]|jgi:hypothetical protein